jgi:hypothetical protein
MAYFRKKIGVLLFRELNYGYKKNGNKIEAKNNEKKNTLPARDIT